MRTLLIILMLASAGIVIAVMLALWFQLWMFQLKRPVLRSDQDIAAFKRLAAFQMYVSLIAIYAVWLPLLVWLAGKFIMGQLTWQDGIWCVFLPFIMQVAISSSAVHAARAVRGTPAADHKLAAARDHVAEVWVKKNLPDW